MRKRIQRLARGQFEYVKPVVEFSEEKISIHVMEDADYPGSFEMLCTNGQKLRGIVYSTNDRMECLTPQFDGEKVRIRYCFHGKGLSEGNICEGSFLIVCSGAQYSLTFDAVITGNYPNSSIGRICNLQEFASLAREHWEEAYQLFYHKSFVHLFRQNEKQERLLYRGFAGTRPSNQNLEEFLIGIHKKEPIRIRAKEDHFTHTDISEPVRQAIHLHKDGWGYLSIHAQADAAFLHLEKEYLSSDDFLGSGCSLYFVIEPKLLHAGRNFAKVTLESAYQKLELTVEVCNHTHAQPSSEHRRIREYLVALTELYQAYRLKRMVTGTWVNETVDVLTELHRLQPEEAFYLLMKAHAYITGRRRQEAEWILDDFKRSWHDRRSQEWGYYLYLMTLLEREPIYVERMTREIEAIFRENPDSVLLFWALTYLEDQYYNNSQEKLRAIGRWIEGGNASPFLFLEAYSLIAQEPYLLRQTGRFERSVLNWACKMKCLTPQVAEQIFVIAESCRTFDPVIYRILCSAYEVNPKPEHIGVICSYLIKGHRYDVKYHVWYEKGVEQELKITGLYEAYLLSLDEREVTKLPRIIQMYFQYRSNLPYQNLALLYSNIIAGRQESPDIYANYIKSMGRFAMEQAQLGHIDDNLAVVYADTLEMGFLDRDIAHSLSGILFTRRLYVYDSNMVRACICHQELKDVQIVPITDHVAYFQAYSEHYVILLEDAYGRRYVSSIPYEEQQLMDPMPYLDKCIALAPGALSYNIAYFNRNRSGAFTFGTGKEISQEEACYNRLISAYAISQDYKAEIASEVLHGLKDRQDGEEFLYSFIREVNVAYLTADFRKYLFELMVEHGLYEKAYEYVQEYGIDQLRPYACKLLADHMITVSPGDEDEFLLLLAYRVFAAYQEAKADAGEQKTDAKFLTCSPAMLQYLCDHYTGPTDQMLAIWQLADAYGLETYELEEQTLSQMLYADQMLDGAEPLFAKYYQNGGREMVVMAYLTLNSHYYFMDKAPGQPLVFDILESRYLYHMEMNQSCKLALFKHLSELKEQTRTQRQATEELLAEFTRQNMYFAFYRNLDEALIRKFYLYDKVILEYRTTPGTHVVLHYCRDEDGEEYIDEEMMHVYDGIYVKLFVMFFGEMTRYYITEEDGSQMRVTENNRLMGIYKDTGDGRRYDCINQMLISASLVEKEELQEKMSRYQELDEVTKTVFRCI